MSAVDVTMGRNLPFALIPSQFSVADIHGSVVAELHPNRFGHVTVMGYTLRIYSRSVPNKELGKGSKRELLWNPTEESVLSLVKDLEGPVAVRRSALLIDGDEQYKLLDKPYAENVGTGIWEVTFYYQEEDSFEATFTEGD